MPINDNKTTRKSANPEASPCSSHQRSALRSVWAHLVLWLITALGLAADLASKSWAVRHLVDPETAAERPMVLIDGYLNLALRYNSGAVFGIAAGKTALLIIVSSAALALLFCMFITTRPGQWLSHIALGMLFAGALGNMYDRIFNHGLVIDFIDVNLHFSPADPWPTFNIADICLTIGVVILLIPLIIAPLLRRKAATN